MTNEPASPPSPPSGSAPGVAAGSAAEPTTLATAATTESLGRHAAEAPATASDGAAASLSASGSGGTTADGDPDAPGRDIVLTPVPPGVWLLILGAVLAALAPLAGFLGGSIVGTGGDGEDGSSLSLFLFGGIVLGGIGLLLALVGGVRLWKRLHASPDFLA